MAIQILIVDLPKRAESYAQFALWCMEHRMSPTSAASCIELCRQASRLGWKQYRKHNSMVNQVAARLIKAGMTEINWDDEWPSFMSPAGERTQLPMKEFI